MQLEYFSHHGVHQIIFLVCILPEIRAYEVLGYIMTLTLATLAFHAYRDLIDTDIQGHNTDLNKDLISTSYRMTKHELRVLDILCCSKMEKFHCGLDLD